MALDSIRGTHYTPQERVVTERVIHSTTGMVTFGIHHSSIGSTEETEESGDDGSSVFVFAEALLLTQLFGPNSGLQVTRVMQTLYPTSFAFACICLIWYFKSYPSSLSSTGTIEGEGGAGRREPKWVQVLAVSPAIIFLSIAVVRAFEERFLAFPLMQQCLNSSFFSPLCSLLNISSIEDVPWIFILGIVIVPSIIRFAFLELKILLFFLSLFSVFGCSWYTIGDLRLALLFR